MKGQYYRIDWDTCDRLGLYGREAMVYCALIYLCKKAPYKGSATELANFSHCGTYKTALRMLSSLEKKGLIIVERQADLIRQIVLCDRQIVQDDRQNVPISKEKSTKKENIIKEIKNNSSSLTRVEKEESASPQSLIFNRLFNMDVAFPLDKPKIPANTGYYRIIVLEYGFMNPKRFVDEFYNYWDGNGWPVNGNKLSLMRSWMDLYKRKHPKDKPSLSNNERAVLRTFVDKIEERIIVRLFNIVQQFEVTDQQIIFYVPKENAQDFAAWLNTLPLNQWFAAYHRPVIVRQVTGDR